MHSWASWKAGVQTGVLEAIFATLAEIGSHMKMSMRRAGMPPGDGERESDRERESECRTLPAGKSATFS